MTRPLTIGLCSVPIINNVGCKKCQPGNLPIQVDQSALNGESLPKTMYPGDTVLQGSVVKRGEIDALVCTSFVVCFGENLAPAFLETRTTSQIGEQKRNDCQ